MTWSTMARIATVVLTVSYPLVVYLGFTRLTTRGVSLLLLALALALLLSRARGLSLARLRDAAVPLLPTMLAAGIAGASGIAWVLLMVPVVVNLGLLASFAATLRPGRVPMIERFARLQEPELDERQRAHCRGVTRVWIAFFAANAAVSAALAAWAPFDWWVAYCGGLAYLAMGALFAGEWLVRRHRFGRRRRPVT